MVSAKKKVIVGMSGGVDSTMCALLLVRKGYEVMGVTMQTWDGSFPLKRPLRSACYGPGEAEDIALAKRAAESIGIRHEVIPLAAEFRREVLEYFRSEYLCGRTPNPCLKCNQVVKFGLLPFLCKAAALSFDFFATGHYARVVFDHVAGQYRLLRGCDRAKDQSYFLSRLAQDQLRALLLPLGEMKKSEVVRIARKEGFCEQAERRESQDFIESGNHTVLFSEAEMMPGPIVDCSGKQIGTHKGIVRYTVGQRTGLNVSVGQRLYVKKIIAETNVIVVGTREEVATDSCKAVDVNWIAGLPPSKRFRCLVQYRYRHAGAEAEIVVGEGNEAFIKFDEKQFGVAPGQGAVFYDGAEVIGGGWIRSA